MNLSDLLKRVTKDDERKMFIFRDNVLGGWTNVDFEVKEHEITVTVCDDYIFSDDKGD